jgi:septal ring factor EnvC (AmiA/AmiB activator)
VKSVQYAVSTQSSVAKRRSDMKAVNVDYIAKAKNLSEEDRDRVLSRMGGKLPKRLQKEKLTVEEAIAIQLELEDEQLQEWRANMAVIQEKAAKAKAKAEEKAAKAKAKEVPAKAAPAKNVAPVAKPATTTKAPAKTAATAKSADKK